MLTRLLVAALIGQEILAPRRLDRVVSGSIAVEMIAGGLTELFSQLRPAGG